MAYDGGWTEPAVPITALTPYLGRFVRFTLVEGLETKDTCGFLSAIHSSQFFLDDHLDAVPQAHVKAAYNIVGKKIAGEGPEVYSRD